MTLASSLAQAIDASPDRVAQAVVAKDLPVEVRANLLLEYGAAIDELRQQRPNLKARTVAGDDVGLPDVERVFVAWDSDADWSEVSP